MPLKYFSLQSAGGEDKMDIMNKIKGEVKTVTFRDEENGYCVLKITPQDPQIALDKRRNIITVVGSLPGIQKGDEAEFYGNWEKHKKFGKQFKAESFRIILPASKDGLIFYLSAHIKGIGPVYAKRIVDKFGAKTVKIIQESPEKLAKIRGITKTKALRIAEEWEKDVSVRDQMIKLSSLSISPNLSLKIIERYKNESFEKIKANPYQLAEDIWGVGFIKADKIAREIGLQDDNPRRIGAGLKYILQKASEEGHLYLPKKDLFIKTSELTKIPPKKIKPVLENLVRREKLVEDKYGAIYLPLYYNAEKRTAEIVKNHIGEEKLKFDLNKAFSWVEKQQNFKLNAGQKKAIETVLQNKLSILTGGPGTGKSTTVDALCMIAKAKGYKISLAAPTGRAAKRMSELSGVEAKTIHRLLKIGRDGKAYYNQENPLEVDFLVVDESSMLDILLALRLFSGISPKTHLLLIGDESQLPSVQAGNVLADLINSNQIPIVRLTEIFRQARQSAIVRNAHKINAGFFPEFPKHPTDFYFFTQEDPEEASNLIVDLVSRRIPREFGFEARKDIQVLAPMHKTECGVSVLNEKLQYALNPSYDKDKEFRYGKRIFRVGDRVMQTVNNYEKQIFNGEIGTIIKMKDEDQERRIIVEMDGKSISYEADELGQLTHAFAVSIHKSQGSEYPAVVVPILTSHYIMLARNLLYTAVTRAKELVVLVGSKKALWIAVKNDKPTQRYTMLAERLKRG